MQTIQQTLTALTAMVMALSNQVAIQPSGQLAQAAGTPPAVVSTAKGGADASATSVASNSINVSSGNLIVAIVASYNSSPRTVSSISDGSNNLSFAPGSRYTDSDGSVIETWYKENATAKSSAVFTASFSGAAQYRRIMVFQISGADTSGSLDLASTNSGTGSSQSCGTLNISQTNEIIIAGFSEWDAHTAYNAGSGFSEVMHPVAPDNDAAAIYDVTSSAGSYPVNMAVTGGGNNRYICTVTSFKSSSSDATPPPSTPSPTISSFSASPSSITSGNSSTLSWSVSDATSLSISSIGSVTGSSRSVSPTQTTTYTLSATNSNGSTQSNTTVTVTSAPPASDTQSPTTPTNLSATAVSSSQINLSWSASSDNTAVTGYDIYRGGTLLTSVSGTSYSNTGLSASTNYSYTVRSKDAAGNTSSQSSSVSATTQAGATPPSGGCQASSPARCWYVDSSVSASGNGQSWATAWKNVSNISGVSGGDIVYISGGSSSQTYSGNWTAAGGSSGTNRVTYRIGQDSGRNGIAVFSGTVTLGNNVILDGLYNGEYHFTFGPVMGEAKRYITVQGFTTNSSWSFNGDTQYYEVAHFRTGNINGDHFISFNGPTTLTWDANKIHDCEVNLAHDTDGSGFGTDGFQNIASVSIYDCTFTGVRVAGARGNHQDAIQTDGRYLKVYNNRFVNLGNYSFFFEGYSGGNDVRVYNNVFIYDESSLSRGFQQAVAIGEGWSCATANAPFKNFILANNTVIDKVGLGNNPFNIGVNSCSDVWDSSTVILNNVVYSTSGQGFQFDSRIPTSPSNKTRNTGGTSIFADYNNNNFHLLSTDTLLRDAGVSTPSAYYNTDLDGVLRPQGSAWDIGAYESSGGSTPPPPPTYKIGDFNLDGLVNSIDFSLLVSAWNTSNTTYDLNHDGLVNTLDYAVMVQNWSV